MQVIFFRHGERIDDNDTGLTMRGRDMAVAAGAWLRERGYRPSHAMHTGKVRTRETLTALLDGSEIVPARRSFPSQPDRWVAWLQAKGDEIPTDSTLLLVGHGPTQAMLERLFPHAAAPKANRCAGFVLQWTERSGWQCTDQYAGAPTGVVQLRQPLPQGELAIIGDVHGELDALVLLLQRLGVDTEKLTSPRKLVFVGDLVDRGPDSVGVVELVMRMVEAGIAVAVLGNHELNLLRREPKEGNHWFYGDPESDGKKVPYSSRLASPTQRDKFLGFFASLPLVLERSDLQVVHACPAADALAMLPVEGLVADLCATHELRIRAEFEESGCMEQAEQERLEFALVKENHEVRPRLPNALAKCDAAEQAGNPIKVLTSGMEEAVPPGNHPFWAGEWRLVDRVAWWQQWSGKPTVTGHYWRNRHEVGQKGVFAGVQPFEWCNGVFCVDYSVGKRYEERAKDETKSFTHGLAALLWPERTLVFDDRPDQPTFGFLPTQARAALYGHLAGDALGVPYEFSEPRDLPQEITWRGYGTHRQPPGTWSDDGALMLATAGSLADKCAFVPEDVAQRFVGWLDRGEMAAGGIVFDIGNTTRAAIDRLRAGKPALKAGPDSEQDNGNGSLMRVLPVSLWTAYQPVSVQVAQAHAASQLTHGHVRSQVCCAVYSVLVGLLVRGAPRVNALERSFELVAADYGTSGLTTHAAELAEFRKFDRATGSGYVVDCLWSAWIAVRDADSYVDAVTRAVRFGHDTDTTAATAGGLAGIVFGLDGVPAAWRESLRLEPAHKDVIERFARAVPEPTAGDACSSGA